MSDYRTPTEGFEYGPCAICGRTALPMYGEFLCPVHGSKKYADKAKAERENDG